MAEYKFPKQTDYGFPFTFAATDKFPLIANRIFDTYDKALDYVNNFYGTAVEGLLLSVYNDPKNRNGVYRISKVASADGANDGVLDRQGSANVDKYTDAIAIADASNLGQIIYVKNDETIEYSGTTIVATAGAYMVSGSGMLSKVGTTTVSGDIAEQVAILEGKVGTLETTVEKITPVSGDYINTSTSDSGTTLSVNISSDEGNLLETGSDNGLAAMFYWEGDDDSTE